MIISPSVRTTRIDIPMMFPLCRVYSSPNVVVFRNLLLVVFLGGGELMYRFLRAIVLKLMLVGLELACIRKIKRIDKDYVDVSSS